jgi:hypothetical protein
MRTVHGLLLFVPVLASAAGKPSEIKLSSTTTQLLGDHLRISLPVGMKLEARGHSIMMAEQSTEDETRGVIDVGKSRFVMLAIELYALKQADFRAGVVADGKTRGIEAPLEALTLAKPLTGFASAPPTKGDRDANIVYAAWIANADDTVQVFAFYANPDGAKDAAEWAALARKAVATLTGGKRALPIKAGDHSLGEGSEALVVTLPAAWVDTTQAGPDFFVFHLRKLGPLATRAPSCGIYVGNHGAYQHLQQEVDEKAVSNVAGNLLGAAVQWHVWSDGENATTEAMVPHPKSSETVHVFCNAATVPELTDLRRLVSTLRSAAP